MLKDSKVYAHTFISETIIGWRCIVGKWVYKFFSLFNSLLKINIYINYNKFIYTLLFI